MELSALYKRFTELVGDGDMSSAVYDVLMSGTKDNVLAQYVDMVDGDLQTDYLQRIYQYYFADRKEKCQDYTPISVAKLCARLTETPGKTVYDLCAGSGALTIQKWAHDHEKTFVCEELDGRVIPFLLFNMAVRNMRGLVVNVDALTRNYEAVYCLDPWERFSTIKKIDVSSGWNLRTKNYEIISNPPYNIKWEPPAPLLADERFDGKPMPPAANANFAFVLTALNLLEDGGRCAFVLPCGVLSSDNEKEVRAHLVKSGRIERVIMLPDRMFEATSIPTCVVVFSSGNRSVKFYDLRKKAVQWQRDQNGQFGGASHENRVYHKTVNVLTDEIIDYVCGECEDTLGLSKEVDLEAIEKQDYTLISGRYIDQETVEITHRPYADIMADINRVARERGVLKLTCNETFAKQIGIYDMAQIANAACDENLNKTFEKLGGHYEGKRYITLTKSKEFKVENQDKETWSSLIPFFIQMWKQHIYYLNQEENRLLAELRDALLPDLMSGKLEV